MTLVSGYAGPRRSWIDRMIAAARLDVTVYEEVEADDTATSQAAGVVVVSAIAQAIGASKEGLGGIISAPIGAIIGWLLWAGLTYFIGKVVFKGTATWGELLRTLGFAQAPGVLYVLAVIPFFGDIVKFVIAVWVLIAGVIAIRQALDISTGKAIVVAIIGWAVIIIPIIAIGGAAFIAGAGMAR